jgi:hypothetical protein
MHTVGSFVETLSGLEDCFGLALYLHPDSSFQNVAYYRARITVGKGSLARLICNFDDFYTQMSTVQRRQSVRERHSGLRGRSAADGLCIDPRSKAWGSVLLKPECREAATQLREWLASLCRC